MLNFPMVVQSSYYVIGIDLLECDIMHMQLEALGHKSAWLLQHYVVLCLLQCLYFSRVLYFRLVCLLEAVMYLFAVQRVVLLNGGDI